MKMKPIDFIKKFLPYSLETQRKYGIHYLVSLTQAAVETGWGDKMPGGMVFGRKDNDGINGNEILVRTREVMSVPDYKFPVIHGIKQISSNKWEYDCECYFRKFNSLTEAFDDHATILLTAKWGNGKLIYGDAIQHKSDPIEFLKRIAPIYATGTAYKELLVSVCNSIEKIVIKNNLT